MKVCLSVRFVVVVVVVVSGAYTEFVEPRISVTAWMQERPHALIRKGHCWKIDVSIHGVIVNVVVLSPM